MIFCGAGEIACHPRIYDRGQFIFDPKRYLALLEPPELQGDCSRMLTVPKEQGTLASADADPQLSMHQRPVRTLQTGIRWFGAGSGGLDRVFFDLVNTLPDCGIEVRGLVVEPADVGVATRGRICAFAPEGATLLRRLMGARQKIDGLIGAGNVDLVAAHFAPHIAMALDRLRGLPLVMHFHGPWADESRCEGQGWTSVAAKRALETLVYRRADRFIVLSYAFAAILTKRYGAGEESIRVVPGSVDLARFNTGMTRIQARHVLGWPTDRKILLAVRRLTERMGLDLLIKAMGSIARIVPEALLFIAGKGRLEASLRRQVDESGLAPHVRFLGFIPDIELPLAYRAADINVVPSVALEGFGLTAAEALAAGTPSMVTAVEGLPEVITDLSPDLVFASGDAGGMADGLICALRGEFHLPDAESCQAYAATKFSRALATSRTAAVYRELVH